MNVLWSAQAVQDLAEILDSIPRDKPGEAHATCDEIERSAASLGDYPESGRPGLVDGTRETIVPAIPYTIVYTVNDTDVTVISICRDSVANAR